MSYLYIYNETYTVWHENLHRIKFYGFTVGDTTIKSKSANFYSTNSVMSLLKIRQGMWPTMTPDLHCMDQKYFAPPFYSSALHSQLVSK